MDIHVNNFVYKPTDFLHFSSYAKVPKFLATKWKNAAPQTREDASVHSRSFFSSRSHKTAAKSQPSVLANAISRSKEHQIFFCRVKRSQQVFSNPLFRINERTADDGPVAAKEPTKNDPQRNPRSTLACARVRPPKTLTDSC